MKQNYCFWEKELPSELVESLKEMCEKAPKQEGVIFSAKGDGFVEGGDVRKSQVSWILDSETDEMIWRYVSMANKLMFGFDIEKDFAVQYTTYKGEEEGHYDWHQDTDMISKEFRDRKLSVVIQLSDDKDYEGGDFQFEFNTSVETVPGFRKKGSILIFPSFLKHKVTKVTKGTRNSLVSWIMGPNFK